MKNHFLIHLHQKFNSLITMQENYLILEAKTFEYVYFVEKRNVAKLQEN